MVLSADSDVQKVAEFMQENIPANRLAGVAMALNGLAPALWGHLPSAEVRALSLQGVKPTQ